jgi:hypothetical protein
VSEKRCERIRCWFQSCYSGPGLILPDGWFGRPGDNIHALTFLEARKDKLLLELDDQLLLIFTSLKEVRDEGAEIVLSPFSQLVFDWQEYGSLTPHAYLYRGGEVRFVQPNPPSQPSSEIDFQLGTLHQAPLRFEGSKQDWKEGRVSIPFQYNPSMRRVPRGASDRTANAVNGMRRIRHSSCATILENSSARRKLPTDSEVVWGE